MKRWYNLSIILKIYLTVTAIFFCFRFILFLTELSLIDSFRSEFFKIVIAFLIGIRFDLVISGYILIFPFVIISVMFIVKKQIHWLYLVIFYWIFILFTLAFIICAADIPYFNHFFSRFSVGAFQWMNSPVFILKMIFQEPRYFMIIPPLIILLVIFFRLLRKIFRISPDQIKNTHVALNIIFSILVLGLIFIGIRGRIQAKAPIKVGTAYFSDNPLLNQLGLNPVFTLIRSYLDSKDERNKSVEFMDDNQAIRNVRKYLKITQPVDGFPVARQIQPGEPIENRYNVILVIMESMSAARMARNGNKNNLTPFLDSLSFKSYYFENIYTAGVHSFNGVFSTLFSFPAIYRQNPMKESSILKYNGIGNILKRNGYSTTCFTTLDGQFDNVEGFLRANDFENFISESDYPSKEIRTALGVPDDFMFEYSMPVIDNLYKENKPFFITFLTASDHRPYYIPDYFKPKNSDISDQIVEYADWSLRKFITLASAKAWFDNTLFVFVADHGTWTNMVYDIPLDYFHTPLIFYGPGILKPRTFDCIGGQIDVFPTIMGILNQKYINNTLGINLLSETRPYIFINFDNMLGVIDQEYLLILKPDNENALYSYRNNDRKNYLSEKQQLVLDMEEYNFSNLQVFQYLMHSEKRYIDY